MKSYIIYYQKIDYREIQAWISGTLKQLKMKLNLWLTAPRRATPVN